MIYKPSSRKNYHGLLTRKGGVVGGNCGCCNSCPSGPLSIVFAGITDCGCRTDGTNYYRFADYNGVTASYPATINTTFTLDFYNEQMVTSVYDTDGSTVNINEVCCIYTFDGDGSSGSGQAHISQYSTTSCGGSFTNITFSSNVITVYISKASQKVIFVEFRAPLLFPLPALNPDFEILNDFFYKVNTTGYANGATISNAHAACVYLGGGFSLPPWGHGGTAVVTW